MAQIAVAALAASGGFAPGAILGPFIAGMAASYIDQAFIFPALRGEPEIPDTLQDLQIQTVAEGSPLARFYGPQCYLPGQLIWSDELRTLAPGGKGLGADRQAATPVIGTFMVAFGEGRTGAKLEAMWADEKLIYNSALPPQFFIPAADYDLVQGNVYTFLDGDLTWAYGILRIISQTSTFAADLTQFKVGSSVVLIDLLANTFQDTSWLEPGTTTQSIPLLVTKTQITNDGRTEITLDVRNTGPPFTIFHPGFNTDYNTFLPTVAGGGLTATSEIDGEFEPFDQGLFPTGGGITVFPGNANEEANPIIEAVEGVGNVETYRGIATAMIDGLLLNDFGNRLPNITAIWQNVGLGLLGDPEAYSLKNVYRDVLLRSNLSLDKVDLDKLDIQVGSSGPGIPVGNIFNSSPTFGGYVVRGIQETSKVLQPISISNMVLGQEREGVIHFFLRKNADEVTVDPDDLASHIHGETFPAALPVVDDPDASIPSRVAVKFLNLDNDLQPGHTGERNQDQPFVDVRTMSLNISMKQSDADDLAFAHLWTLIANRKKIGPIRLPPSYIYIAEGDVIKDLTVDGQTYDILVTKVDRGDNFLMEIEGMVEEQDTLLHTS